MSHLAVTTESDTTGGRNITCLPFSLSGPMFDSAIGIYARAFAAPPYLMEPEANERAMAFRLSRMHGYKQGLVAIAAVEGERTLGMTYGYHLDEDDWWGGLVRARLSPESQADWCDDAFVVVELAVEPGLQGRGIGTALLAAVLEGRHERTALLSTRTDVTAHRLYRRLGFEVLTEMNFEHSPWHFIMGRRL